MSRFRTSAFLLLTSVAECPVEPDEPEDGADSPCRNEELDITEPPGAAGPPFASAAKGKRKVLVSASASEPCVHITSFGAS